MSLNSALSTPAREIVLESLSHRQPSKMPVDFGATTATGMHVTCVAALRDHFGLEKRPVKVHEPYQMLGLIEDDLQQAIGVETEGLFGRTTMFGFRNENWKPLRFQGIEVLVAGMFNTTIDPNGNWLMYPQGDVTAAPSGLMPKDGFFFDTITRQNHFDENHLDPRDNCEEFKLLSDAAVAEIAADARAARATGRAVATWIAAPSFGGLTHVGAPALKDPRGIRDVTEWYMSTKCRKDYIHAVFQTQLEIELQNLEKIRAAAGNLIDVYMLCGTDFGTQNSTFCSLATFRDLWLPYYKEVCAWIHRNTSWKCFKHSCGSVVKFIDSFIEAGFDILNPVQCSAAGMDPGQLKERFGDRIVFWGGGVDTQETLPFGSPTEVREQVLRRCEIFARDGGIVFATVHNVQAGTPVENIVAMLDAVRDFNGR